MEMIYSQNNEQQIIFNYFSNHTGTCLSLGENDGITLSNVFAAIQKGWSGVLVEASPSTFNKLKLTHVGNGKVHCYNVAVGEVNGKVKFYESGPLLSSKDSSLVSTIDRNELARWPKMKFKEFEVNCITIKDLIDQSPIKKFDLISIDVEGMDWIVLKQMDLKELGCKMLIVEFNGKEKQKYVDYCSQYGMKLHGENAENLIFVI